MLQNMVARATGSTTICFGLVSIPVKIFTATHSESVSFNTLHKECGTRVKQLLYCPTHDKNVERDDTIKGYEFAKGQYVTFTNEELRLLESERSNTVDIVEFVPASTIDFINIDKTQYLGPDKGGHKAYGLLAQAMLNTGLIAIGRYNARGKSYVVMLRPFKKGLALHTLFYADEVRAFDEIELGEEARVSEAEQGLAEKLIDQLRAETFDPSQYRDDFSDRVRAAAEEKSRGMEIVASQEAPPAQIIDLFEALKQSLDQRAGSDRTQVRGPKKTEPKAEESEKRPSKRKTGAA
jgi:DNA end-binding protein Ku